MQGLEFEAGSWPIEYCDLRQTKQQEKLEKYWHLPIVRSRLKLPDARSAPTEAAAADNAADGSARLHKLMPHIAHLCTGIVNALL